MEYEVDIDNVRLDNYLCSMLDKTRSQVTKMIKNGEVLVNWEDS